MTAWWTAAVAAQSETARAAARLRQTELTKPPGALGRLETLAIQYAAWQGTAKPQLEHIWISVFAADHGIAAEAVSAFPQTVTTEMIRNFARGGAAISVLARALGAQLEVIDCGSVLDPGPLPGVRAARIAAGSHNFVQGEAMTAAQCEMALAEGLAAAERAHQAGAQLFIGGEMGIANSTAASALGCALLTLQASDLVGPGTGLDAAGVAHKARIVTAALQRHGARLQDPLQALCCVGGFEIAALCGAYIRCAQLGIPSLVDGFIASSAALVATRLNPAVRDWLLPAHASAEPGHARLLAGLQATPLLDLGLRLGEGSGAAVAVPLLRLALELHNGMATFAEAQVSKATESV